MDASDWDERYRSAGLLWSEGPNLFVEDRLRDRTPGRGVDLGSGEGRNAIWLAGLGWDMVAVDFSAVAVERGRQRSDSVEFVVADVFDWEPDGLLDLVLIAYLQVEAPPLQRLTSKTAGWLAPGGELFLVGHHRSNIEHGVGGPQRAEILWDLDEILPHVGSLDIVEAEVVERPVDVEGATRHARDALIRARHV